MSPQSKARLCPKCDQNNEGIFILCTNCGFDLSTIAEANASRLWLLTGVKKYECKNGDVLGREGTVAREFFSSIGTVSRKHLTVSHKDGCWFICVPEGVQNISQLDGKEMPRGTEQRLQGEHLLKLSTQCEVRLRIE